MLLSKIVIKNYRLLTDTELNVDENMTLIVGRNNTAKTSCVDLINRVLHNKTLSYDDYPLSKRKEMYELLSRFMNKEISYYELCEKLPVASIEFFVDYSLDDSDANLGALSPFIIDVDLDTTTAYIRAEYSLKMDKDSLWKMLESCFYANGTFECDYEEARDVCMINFTTFFGLTVYAVNPKNNKDTQVKSHKELAELFPFYTVPAERVLGEDGMQNNNSLGSLITGYFDVDVKDIDPKVADEVKELRNIIETANKDIQKRSDELLSSVVSKAVGFGYPNTEELQLGVSTRLQIDDQIKNQTILAYAADIAGETLPSSHNGLGYKNLIKMEFLLAAYAKEIERGSAACIPLLFIEEPESHMHPQMQHAFADYLESFLSKISDVHIQTFLTSHLHILPILLIFLKSAMHRRQCMELFIKIYIHLPKTMPKTWTL